MEQASRMAKLASLRSKQFPSVPEVTRTRPWLVAGPMTLQLKLPMFCAAAARVVQVAPPSRESSILTVAPALLLAQARLRFSPTIQLSPPLGADTVTLHATGV